MYWNSPFSPVRSIEARNTGCSVAWVPQLCSGLIGESGV